MNIPWSPNGLCDPTTMGVGSYSLTNIEINYGQLVKYATLKKMKNK